MIFIQLDVLDKNHIQPQTMEDHEYIDIKPLTLIIMYMSNNKILQV